MCLQHAFVIWLYTKTFFARIMHYWILIREYLLCDRVSTFYISLEILWTLQLIKKSNPSLYYYWLILLLYTFYKPKQMQVLKLRHNILKQTYRSLSWSFVGVWKICSIVCYSVVSGLALCYNYRFKRHKMWLCFARIKNIFITKYNSSGSFLNCQQPMKLATDLTS